MKALGFLLAGFFVCSVVSLQTQSPAWIINPNMDAGEIVCVNGSNAATYVLTPTTKTMNQHFNKTSFSIVPNVILSMIGYSHSAPSLPTDQFGFRILITNVSLLNFTYTLTTYACQVYDLHYLYLAVQYDTSTFFMGSVTQTFSASSNLGNATAPQRWQTFTYNNPTGWNNPNFSTNNTQIIAFPTGFQIMAQSGWSYFGVNATLLNSTSYTVNISTSGNNILYFIDFSIITFNGADISANYSVYDDIMLTTVVGNSTTYYPPVISASQYMFRNCLTGAVDIAFKVTGVALVWYYYGYSSTNNDFLVWRTFNNRVRSCPANLTYYNPGTSMCQDMCEPYYYVNTTYKVCLPCAYSCYNCSQANSASSCTVCSATDHRSLSGTSCICNDGYYDNGVALCAACNYRCLTCTSGTSTACLTCNAATYRTFNVSTNECLCNTGYYENNTCITCQSNSVACTSCSYNTTTSTFKCLACDGSLFRILDSVLSKCVCQAGYYENSAFTCQPCSLGCLVCSYDGVNPICTSCDASLNRIMGTGNLSCDCQAGYYQNANGTCSVCPIGCLSCSFDGTSPICASCNSPNRTLASGNTSCPCLSTFYEDANSTCQPCQLGCLTCALLSSTVTCSSCDSSLLRVLSASNTSCACMNGFYQNSSQLCAACQKGCLTCYASSTSSVCTSCDSAALRIMGSDNLTCDCQQGTYQATNNSCLSCPTNCTSCVLSGSNIICSACVMGYYPNGSGTCAPCSVGCLNCQFNAPTSSQVCTNCSASLNFTLQGSSCGCINGTILVGTSCIANSTNTTNTTNNTNNTNTTNTTNTTTNGTNTTSNCGNGLLQSSEGCDDGNTIGQDGCSSSCQVEQYHTCIDNATLYNVSLCYYSNKIQLSPSLIYKVPGKNTVELQLKVVAPLCNSGYLKNYLEQTTYLALFDKTRLLYEKEGKRLLQGSLSWISIPAKTISYDPATNILTIVFDYDATIDLSQKYIQFIPSSSTNTSGVKYFYASPTAQLTLSQPYNNLPTVYYSSQELSTVKSMKYLFLVLIIFYWIFFLLALIRKKGVIGTESMLVLQITYLALIDQEKIVEGWSGLQLTGRYTIGFNPKLMDTVYEPDLYALEIDSNLINVLNITLALILLLFVLLVVYKIYSYIENKRRIKKLMEMDVSQPHQSVKGDKPQINTFDKVMVYVVDTLLSFLFLAIGVFMIAILFTNSSNLVNNIIQAAIISIILIVFWIFFYRNIQSYCFKNISYLKIIINANKTAFDPKIKFIIQNYYIIVYGLWMAAALLMSLVRNIGIAAYAIIIFGSLCAMLFHIKYKIFFEILDSRRCIVNNATLIVLMLISLFSSILGGQLGVGLSIVIVVFCILLLLLTFNLIVFMILEKKRIKVEKQKEIHDEQMKQMDNELAMANISFIGKGYNSINKSRDFTKDKEFLNSLEFTSTRKKVLLDDQNKIVALIEDKIKELKDFKKNIQGQLDITPSQQIDLPQNSENNATIQNVLGQLGLIDIDGVENQLNEI